MTTEAIRVFVGWDSREAICYEVCRRSILEHASGPVEVVPIKQSELRAQGLYTRTDDPLASTEFTYTRFLTPHLAGWQGLALFCDCDFLWQADVGELVALARADRPRALWCVQHDYRPSETIKMDDRVQTVYPRKNWSSLMLFDCGHPANAALSPARVSAETGAFLHRMQWLEDADIGAVPEEWNWLEGWSNLNHPDVEPKVIHYTRGGPWFENWQHVAYADRWLAAARAVAAEAYDERRGQGRRPL
ncbi:MAG: glycosyltransferase [Alphaproteobacteria bacterium]|nr:glycosyltransferase [Alphaproteobacteria bacterium]